MKELILKPQRYGGSLVFLIRKKDYPLNMQKLYKLKICEVVVKEVDDYDTV